MKYYYDDWSNTGPSAHYKHQIEFDFFKIINLDNYNTKTIDNWWNLVEEWCDKNIGVKNWLLSKNNTIFYFKNKDDAMLFKLVWGNNV